MNGFSRLRLLFRFVFLFLFAPMIPHFPEALALAAPATNAAAPRERLLFDFGWKFHLGNEWGIGQNLAKAGTGIGPASVVFSDAGWRTRRPSARLGGRAAVRSHGRRRARLQGARRRISAEQRRLVPAHLHVAAADAGPATLARIRRRLSRRHRVRQRLVRRPPRKRLQRVPLRHHRRRQARRAKRGRRTGRRHGDRGLVLRRRRNLPPRLAGQDRPAGRRPRRGVRATAPSRTTSPAAPRRSDFETRLANAAADPADADVVWTIARPRRQARRHRAPRPPGWRPPRPPT